jgi:hypothetical protein
MLDGGKEKTGDAESPQGTKRPSPAFPRRMDDGLRSGEEDTAHFSKYPAWWKTGVRKEEGAARQAPLCVKITEKGARP